MAELKPTFIGTLYGEPGAGKSWFAASAPAPRLIVDAEGRAKYTPGKKMAWDPATPPPTLEYLTENGIETVVVAVKSFDSIRLVYTWLITGQHPFVSVVVDSLMECQKKCIDGIAKQAQMTTPMWGELLRKLEGLVRSSRDIALEELNPLHVVVFVCGTTDLSASGVRRPLLQGQLAMTMPYYVDVVGFLKSDKVAAEDGTLVTSRKLLVDSYEGYICKDNTGAIVPRFGPIVAVTDGEASVSLADLFAAVKDSLAA